MRFFISQSNNHIVKRRRFLEVAFALILMALLGGCGFLFGSTADTPAATPTQERKLVPTFTPTPIAPAQAASPTEPPAASPVQVAAAPADTAANDAPAAASPTPTTVVTPTATAGTEARLTVAGDAVNIRVGPDTAYDLVGTATKGQTFTLVAKNPQGDWWQICCIDSQSGWIFGSLASVENAEAVAVAADIPTPPPSPTPAPPTATPQPASTPTPSDPSVGDFDPNAAYQIVHYKVLGLNENNGGIRDSRAQHLIFVTVLDQNGNGVDGAVVKNLVGDHSQVVTGGKGPGKAEITMYYEPFKLTVVSDPSGPTTSQVSNQMGLAFPHLPDIVGQLGGTDYEYAVCPTLEIKCDWPIHAVHFSYEITFQKVK